MKRTNKSLTANTQVESIRLELQRYIDEHGISQVTVARGIGKTHPVISQFLNNKYPGDVEEVARAIESWLTKQHEKAASKKVAINYVQTSVAKKVREILRIAHVEAETVALIGQASLGKSTALKAYSSENPDAILIDTDPTFTAKVMMQTLAASIGEDSHLPLHDLNENIINRLKGSGRIILVDEAENLPLRALECLRRVHDKAGVGLVLAGMPRLMINLRGKNGELKQLYSRVAFKLDMGEAIPDSDLRMIVDQALPGIEEDVALEFVAAADGNTRKLSKLIGGVTRLARINDNADISPDMVRQFKEMLIH